MDGTALWWANYAYGQGFHTVTIDPLLTNTDVEQAHGYEDLFRPGWRIAITRAAYKDQFRAGKRRGLVEARP